MGNRDTEAAWSYHEATKHSRESVRTASGFLDWDNEPLPFKLYLDLEPIPLPEQRKPLAVSALESIASTVSAREGHAVPDPEMLAHLFYLSAGITKRKSYPGGEDLYRAASCTGALYHIELYLICEGLPGLEAGLYHFGPADFALRRLRRGDWRSLVVKASGGEPALARAPAAIIFTSTFWRNSWKYGARTYRHSFWDSGTLLANLLAVATAQKLPARIVMGFADAPVNRLLGVEPTREAVLGVVALGAGGSAPPAPPGAPEPLSYKTAPLSRAPLDYPEIGAAHRASCLESGEEAAAWRRDPGKEEPEKDGSPPAGGSLCQLAPLGELPADSIEEVIRRRGSTRRFARTPIALAQLSTILQTATGGIPADYLEPLGASLNGLYVIAHSVEGLPAGAYFYRGESHALEQLKKGNFRREAGYLDLEQDLAADASANIYCLADLRPVLGRFGNRGYRAAQLEGGILGGRIYLAAYAQRLGATGLTFYDDDVTRFFSPHAEGKSVMFLTAVGRRAKRAVLYQR